MTASHLHGATCCIGRKYFFDEFCTEFTKEMNRLRMEQRAGQSSSKRELERVRRDIQKVIEAIKAGYAGAELKAEMEALQVRKEALLAQLTGADEPPPLLHPSVRDGNDLNVVASYAIHDKERKAAQ